MRPTFFPTPAALRTWLRRNHATARELWVGFYKKDSGRPSVTWPESVDEALCVGWIDGIRKSLDAESYMIRFTPRRAQSIWSAINVGRVAELTRSGRMLPAGLATFAARDPRRSAIYSFERKKAAVFSPAEQRAFRADKTAWKAFEAMPPGYRRTATHWVTSAKRAETRARRLRTLIADSAAGLRIGPMRRPGAAAR